MAGISGCVSPVSGALRHPVFCLAYPGSPGLSDRMEGQKRHSEADRGKRRAGNDKAGGVCGGGSLGWGTDVAAGEKRNLNGGMDERI